MPTESMMSLWRVALTSNDARAIAGQRAGIELMRPRRRPDTMLAARPTDRLPPVMPSRPCATEWKYAPREGHPVAGRGAAPPACGVLRRWV